MTRAWGRHGSRTILSALAAAFWFAATVNCRLAASESSTGNPPEWPQAKGAVFALRNTHVATPVVAFDAKGRDLLDFNCLTRGRAVIGRFYELVCDGGSFLPKGAGTWIGMQVAKSGVFTIEATITPREAQPKTPAVVLVYGNDTGEDVALLQERSGLALRIAKRSPMEVFSVEAGKAIHVVVTCDKDKWTAYRDGKPVTSGELAAAPTWEIRELRMGARETGSDPWRGRVEGIAVFPRVLTAEEVAAEAAVVKALQAGRKPAPTIRFKGTLVRQAKTSALREIRPYTRSMSAAEYKVEKVLAGDWKEPTITVLHWMIMDSKRLPIADRQPGVTVELSVERVEDNPQLERERRDEIEGDIATDLFYCENENG